MLFAAAGRDQLTERWLPRPRQGNDKTLEALIARDREAEEALQAPRDNSNDAPPERSRVEAWADVFAPDLERQVARAPLPTPDLAVSVELPDGGEPVTLVLLGGEVTVGASRPSETPFASLLLTDDRAATALGSSDVPGLLDCILDGSCVLTGQIEPFVWLVGRMVDPSSYLG